ncbi:MAG: ABC transporter substrate-binding protein [Candidatus Caldatribacteriaceae bacterium]
MRKKIFIWSVVLLLIFLVSGILTEAQEKVSLRFVYCGTSEPEKAWSAEYKKDLEKRYPHITIEYMYIPWAEQEKKLAIMTQAGDYPDLVQVQDVTTLSAMGILEPLDKYIDNPESRVKRSDFYTAAFDYSLIDGVLYSIPAHMTVYGLIVNKNMLAQAGFATEDLKTWDDMLAVAQKITHDEIYAYGYAAGLPRFAWRDAMIAGYSNNVLISDTTPESRDKYMEVLQWYETLKKHIPPAAVTWSYPDMFRAFCQEEVAMIAAGSFFTANVYAIDPNIVPKSRAVVYPKGPSADRPQAMVANAGWAILKGSKAKENAWFVIEDLSQRENLAKESAVVGMPARKDIAIEEFAELAGMYYPDIKEANKQIIEDWLFIAQNFGVSQAKIPRQGEMEVKFQEKMYALLSGNLDIQSFYKEIVNQIEEIRKK